MANSPVTVEKTATGCQVHCRGVTGAGFFSFYGPLGMCHCVSAEFGQELKADDYFLGGSVECGAGKTVNKETEEILTKAEDGCFEAGISYLPWGGEPASTQVNDSIACQTRLQQDSCPSCTHFVFFPADGSCRLIPADAPKESGIGGAVSGPRHCSQISTELKVASGHAVVSEVGSPATSFVWLAGGFAVSVAVVASFIALRRRDSSYRRMMRPGRSDLEGQDESLEHFLEVAA